MEGGNPTLCGGGQHATTVVGDSVTPDTRGPVSSPGLSWPVLFGVSREAPWSIDMEAMPK
jgi:hypothetical protein